MGLFSSLFKRQASAPPATAGGDSAPALDVARTRSRRRLIGAVVLLGVGVIAFPLLFETQPRPIPVDIPIEIPRKDNAPALLVPPPRPVAVAASKATPPAPVITESKADAGKELSAPAEPAAKPVTKPVTKPAPAPETPAKPVTPVEPKASAAPLPAAEAKPPADATGRFVVQIGAFADTAIARETRSKAEKLGFKTYTQVVDTDNGKRTRVRLGPFVSRDEADKAADKVKAAGLPAAVLTL